MKTAARLILLLFVVFLSTPTIVSIIKKSGDTSCFFSMAEEEQAKELKAAFKYEEPVHIYAVCFFVPKKIITENLSRHDNVNAVIFVPPPELG